MCMNSIYRRMHQYTRHTMIGSNKSISLKVEHDWFLYSWSLGLISIFDTIAFRSKLTTYSLWSGLFEEQIWPRKRTAMITILTSWCLYMKLYTSRDDPAIVTLKNNSIESTTAAGLNITIDTIFMKKKNLSYNDYYEDMSDKAVLDRNHWIRGFAMVYWKSFYYNCSGGAHFWLLVPLLLILRCYSG